MSSGQRGLLRDLIAAVPDEATVDDPAVLDLRLYVDELHRLGLTRWWVCGGRNALRFYVPVGLSQARSLARCVDFGDDPTLTIAPRHPTWTPIENYRPAGAEE